MNLPHALTALYPPPVRQRWGDELAGEVRASGPRSWADTVVGAVRLWLHPRDWPELIAGHTCAVLTCALAAVTATAALLVRAAEPSNRLTGDPAHPVTSGWLALVLVGVLLAAPRPSLSLVVLRRLAAMALRELVIPAGLVFVMWLVANSGLVSHPVGPTQLGFIVFYWTTLAFGAFRLCRLVARIVAISEPPSRFRMRAALVLLGSGLALAAVQSQLGTVHRPGGVAIGVGLGILAAGVLTAAGNFRGPDS